MGHDKATNLYVSCAYALMTARTECNYLLMLQEIVVQTDYTWEPKHATCDFQNSLLKAIGQEFPETKLQGCYFHWRQCLSQRLKKRALSRRKYGSVFFNIVHPLINDAVDFVAEVLPKELRYNMFFEYFKRTWIEKFQIKLWSSYRIKKTVIARKNNGFERYNRRLGECFVYAYPNIWIKSIIPPGVGNYI
ncbi:hypothetical protein MXB_2218, partial [Myxobolus squamalis]